MAKGQKLPTSRSERLLGAYGYGYDQSHGMVTGGSELAEDDVWSTVNDMVKGDDQSSNSSYSAWIPRPPTEVHRSVSIRSRQQTVEDNGHVSGLSLAFDDPDKTASPRIVHQIRGQEFIASRRGCQMATSAPVNVPDWKKIYRVDSVESLHESDDGGDHDFDMVPPHEYLARSRNSAANSVFEGVGRTLKGRDMSRVRDAVWSQTGFNG